MKALLLQTCQLIRMLDGFPKKLSVDQVRNMKAKFMARYPSEPLAADTMPSPALGVGALSDR